MPATSQVSCTGRHQEACSHNRIASNPLEFVTLVYFFSSIFSPLIILSSPARSSPYTRSALGLVLGLTTLFAFPFFLSLLFFFLSLLFDLDQHSPCSGSTILLSSHVVSFLYLHVLRLYLCPFITTFFLNLLSATESGSRGRSTLAIEDHRVAWSPREDFRIIAKRGAGPGKRVSRCTGT